MKRVKERSATHRHSMKDETTRVAAVTMNSVMGEPETNLARIATWAEKTLCRRWQMTLAVGTIWLIRPEVYAHTQVVGA